MISKEDLEQRLEDLGWTLYKLAKQFSEMRAVDGEVSPATRYHSAIGKAMENPAKSRLETIEGIVQALNGELTIVWEPGRVVTMRLDDEQMAALEERAKTDGTTVYKVAEQLLQLALSGALVQKPKKLTDLVIAEETKIYRSFHPLIASAYSAVHQWLVTRPEAEGYKELDYSQDLWRSLEQTDLKSTAFQYYTLFPRHYFETTHVLENVINSTRLLNGLKYNRRICIVDIGCAMGAASAAFIERIITLQKDESISNPIEIVFLGIDPNIYGITLYSKLMQEIKTNIGHLNINLEFQPICERFPKAVITAMRYLQKKRQEWEQPFLSNLFLIQLDVVSYPNQDKLLRREKYEKLKELGLEPDLLLDTDEEFWQEEALGYKQLLEEVPVDHLHIMILGTKFMERHLQKISNINDLSHGIEEISKAFNRVVGNNHRVFVVLKGKQQVHFENPVDSYWKEQAEMNYSSNFYATFHTINSREVEDDKDWNQLISQENLELAWVRARKNLLDESLYDEIESRLFEYNLQQNIHILQNKLLFYADNLNLSSQEIPFNFVKGSVATRPKQLSRLEQEILATAIIQTVGKKTGRKFSSYRIQTDSDATATEYLYENWLELYKSFKKQVKKSAEEYPDGAVIRTDIKSYYTKVVQEQLLDITKRELKIISERIYWLLGKIYAKNLHGHEAAIGIRQGTITSGFYANLYLSEVDDKFNNDKKLRVKFHRYVDDMIIIVPSASYINEVESTLKYELKKLNLELNKDKTEHYDNISDFKKTLIDDDDLEKLNEEFNKTLYLLWIVNSNYRTEFSFANQNEVLWWHLIKLYQQCLYSLKIYVTENHLSRKIYQSLFQPSISREQELNLPPFPNRGNFSVISNWAKRFEELESAWLDKKNRLKRKIINLFNQSLQELRKVAEELNNTDSSTRKQEKRQMIVQRRRLETRIRFAVNKLSILGFDEVWEEIVNLICGNLFVIRDLLDVVVSLARQGYTDAIKQLKECYQHSEKETSPYMRAVIIEAIRFLPSLDVQDWELIVASATENNSDIERLKATETWLYLGDIAKQFIQDKHIKAVVNALNSQPQPFTRLKKNYILILGMHEEKAIRKIYLSQEENDDYLIGDALKLALEGKVLELFKENEPAVVRQYYSVKRATDGEDKQQRSL